MSIPGGRRSNTVALTQLESITGLSTHFLLEKIPELKNSALAFGISRASDGFGDSEVGRYNAQALEPFVIVRVPRLSVDGGTRNDLTGLNCSYFIDLSTDEVLGFADFHGAEESLADKYCKRIPSSDDDEKN